MSAVHAHSLAALRSAFETGRKDRHARLFCRLVRQGKRDLLSAIQADVMGDDWLDFTFESVKAHLGRARGEIYFVSSAAYPGLVKVGKTRGPAERRLQALNNEAAAVPFVLNARMTVHDRHWMELSLHRALNDKGLHFQKEFFGVDSMAGMLMLEELVHRDLALLRSQGLYEL